MHNLFKLQYIRLLNQHILYYVIVLLTLLFVFNEAYANFEEEQQFIEESTESNNTILEQATSNQDIDYVERSDDDLLIIELRVGRRIIVQDAMFAYLTRGKIFIPFSETMQAIEFPIEVDTGDGFASGWFLKPENDFSLDAIRYQVTIGGKTFAVARDRIEIHYDDIFIDADLLADWFPVNIEAEVANQSVYILSQEELPIEQKIKREKLQGMLGTKKDYSLSLPDYPLLQPVYRTVDWPVIDVRLNSSLRSNNDSTDLSSDASLLMTSDLAMQSSSIFVNADDGSGINNVRIKLGRSSPDGKIFDWANITKYEVGDIFTDQVPLVVNGRSGVGASVSNFPLAKVTDFNRVTLRGDIPVGWEIEAYRNDELLAFQQASDEGRYEFLDLQLVSGLNIIKLKFYGPYGEVREEVKRYLVSNELTKPGTTYFSASAVSNETKLIDVSEASSDSASEGEINAVLEVERGVLQNLSVNSSLVTVSDNEGDRREYFSLGGKATWRSLFSTLQFSKPLDDSGLAMQLGLNTNLDNWGFSLEHREFKDFLSDETDSTNPTVQSTAFRINTSMKPEWEILPRIVLNTGLQRDKNDIGNINYDITQRISTHIKRVSFSNSLRYRATNVKGVDEELDGSLFLSFFLENISLRGELGYEVKPERDFSDTSITSGYKFTDDLQLRFGVNRDFSESNSTAYTMSLNRKFKKFVLGFNSEYDTNDNLAMGMNMTFALGREPRGNDWYLYADQISQDGLLSARTFLDNDQDQTYSDGDILLEGIGFKKSGSPDDTALTNEDGVALISGITSHEIIPIEPDQGTFLDPYWISTQEGYNVLLRPGRVTLVEFPIIPTGEIDGTIYLVGFDKEGNKRADPVSRAKVQLLNNKDEVIKEELSAFDGFYLFSSVPLGAYKVRINPEQLLELDLVVLEGDDEAILTSDELIVSGVDLNLLRVSDIGIDPSLKIKGDEALLEEKTLFEQPAPEYEGNSQSTALIEEQKIAVPVADVMDKDIEPDLSVIDNAEILPMPAVKDIALNPTETDSHTVKKQMDDNKNSSLELKEQFPRRFDDNTVIAKPVISTVTDTLNDQLISDRAVSVPAKLENNVVSEAQTDVVLSLDEVLVIQRKFVAAQCHSLIDFYSSRLYVGIIVKLFYRDLKQVCSIEQFSS